MNQTHNPDRWNGRGFGTFALVVSYEHPTKAHACAHLIELFRQHPPSPAQAAACLAQLVKRARDKEGGWNV